MANFNDDFRDIGAETKQLQEAHMAAKTNFRQKRQKVDGVKDHIAELTLQQGVRLNNVGMQLSTVCSAQNSALLLPSNRRTAENSYSCKCMQVACAFGWTLECA